MQNHTNTIRQALANAAQAVGEPLSPPIHPRDLSVILKYYLLERACQELPDIRPGVVEASTGSGFSQLDSLIQQIWDRDLPRVLTVFLEKVCPALTAEVEQHILSEYFRHRLTFMVWEQLLGKRSAPEVRIYPGRLGETEYRELLGNRPVVLVVFEAFPNVMNECFPLFVDSLVYNLDHFGVQRWQLGAAHVSWLDGECRPRRLALYDAAKHSLVETPCDPLPQVGAVLVLCASPSMHREVSFLANQKDVPELNPYAGTAEWADSKIVSYDLWRRAGVPTPRAALIVRGSSREEIVSKLKQFRSDLDRPSGEARRCFFQPNSGTEGHGVDTCVLRRTENWAESQAANRIEELLEEDDVIVRELVGNVRFRPPERIHGRTCDLRVNVSFDGNCRRAESGCFQVAGDVKSLVSSTSRGGVIWKFSREPFARLYGPNGDRLTLDHSTMERLLAIAESGASVFPGLGLVGVDLKLEVSGSGRVDAQILDANPRPAGLTHSEFFNLDRESPEPGVTRHLWRRILPP